MSTRLKRKLADLGIDTSSNRANESFCLIGTPLPPLEKSKDTGEFVPLWKQDVRDEKGRRRLHGAFTGGFSAGYFNTVGSKEGWTPSTFVSSRSGRAKQKSARPEDFMDEEDLQDLKDSRNIVDTTDEMDLTAGGAGGGSGIKDEPEKDSIVSALETSLLPPPTDSVGAKILKRMGWRVGQGIGPRVSLRKRKLQDKQLSFGGLVSSELVNIPDDDEEASKHTYAPRDTPILLVDRKDNFHGLGYSPGMGLHESGDGKGGGEGSSGGPRISAGFGLGALNDADEDDIDIYDGGAAGQRRRVAYDVTERVEDDVAMIGEKANKDKKPQRPASSVAFFRDGQPVLAGFVLSDKPFSEDRAFPLPDIPKGWTPDPNRVWNKQSGKENDSTPTQAPRAWNNKMTADERGAILGETPLPAAPRSVFEFMSKKDRERILNIAAPPAQGQGGPEAPTESIKIPRTEPQIAQAALRGFQPFSADPVKQARYQTYLQSQLELDGASPPLQPLPNQQTDQFNKEVEDYAKAALLFKPMSAAMAGRFTSAAVVEQGPNIHVGLHTPEYEEKGKDVEEKEKKEEEENISPKAHAARMGMYGPLTRETKQWQPAKLLCKRFKVKEPNPVPEDAEPVPATPSSGWQQPEIPMKAMGMEAAPEASESSGSQREGPRDISNIGLGDDDHQGRDTLTYERPEMNVFKAIFASDDEDEEEEEEEEDLKKEEPDEPTQLLGNATTVSTATPLPVSSIDNGSVDLSAFRPTFIPRVGKAKDKDTDKPRDKDKDKGKGQKRKQRAVLSFAIDEEGGEGLEVKPSKSHRSKKKQRKEKPKDEEMWVEKAVPEGVKDLVLPPPPLSKQAETESTVEIVGPPRGRKRAIDFL